MSTPSPCAPRVIHDGYDSGLALVCETHDTHEDVRDADGDRRYEVNLADMQRLVDTHHAKYPIVPEVLYESDVRDALYTLFGDNHRYITTLAMDKEGVSIAVHYPDTQRAMEFTYRYNLAYRQYIRMDAR